MSDSSEILKFAREQYVHTIGLSQKATQDYVDSRRMDIEQLRSSLIQISSLSLGAVGFSIPVLDSSSVIKTLAIFIVGLFLLSLSSIVGLFYTTWIIQESIVHSWSGLQENRKEIRENLKLLKELIDHPERYDEFLEKQRKLVDGLSSKAISVEIKHDKFSYALLAGFTFGIICIFLSLFRISI